MKIFRLLLGIHLAVYPPDLSVLCESGHSGALLCVVLWQSGADLQHIWLPWLGNHHSVVEGSRDGALGLSLLRLLQLTLGLQIGKVVKWLRLYLFRKKKNKKKKHSGA